MTKARDIASAAPAPSTVSATELGHLDGVTSAIQTQLDAKTAKSTLTTTGDIYYASAANTPARLGIGTASQLLAVNSGATAPEWVAAPSSGGMTLINTGGTTLTGASVTISSIPSTYKELVIYVENPIPSNNGTDLRIRFNADTSSNYVHAFAANTTASKTNAEQIIIADGQSNTGGVTGAVSVTLPNYSNAVANKLAFANFAVTTSSNTANWNFGLSLGVWNNTAAINEITFFYQSGTHSSGTVYVYGVK
jgi:hypothetical protein